MTFWLFLYKAMAFNLYLSLNIYYNSLYSKCDIVFRWYF